MMDWVSTHRGVVVAGVFVILLILSFACSQDAKAEFDTSSTVYIADPGGSTVTLGAGGQSEVKGYIAWSNTVGFRLQTVDANDNTDSVFWPVPTNSVVLPANIKTVNVAHSDTVFFKALK